MAEVQTVRLQTQTILWGALLTTIPLFFVAMVSTRGQMGELDPQPILLIALGGAGLTMSALSLVLPKRMYLQALAAAKFEVQTVPDDGSSALYREGPSMRVFAKPADVAQRTPLIFQTALILGMAFSESVAIFGFVLGMQGFGVLEVAPFFVVSVILLLVRFPTGKSMFSPLEHAYRAKLDCEVRVLRFG